MGRDQPELGDYVSFVRRNALLLGVCTLLGLAGGVLWEAQTPPTYTAMSSVLLTPVPGYIDLDPTGRPPRDVTIDTDAHLVRSAATVGAVASAVGIDRRDAAAGLNVSAPSLTQVLHIRFTAATPRDASVGATTAARTLVSARRDVLGALQIDQIARMQLEVTQLTVELDALGPSDAGAVRQSILEDQISTLRARLDALYAARTNPAEILEAAQLPTSPDNSDPEVSLATGLLLGLCFGLGAGMLQDRRQRRRAARLASIASTSSPNRTAASLAV